MNAAHENIVKRVCQWIQFAEDDLRMAEHALQLSSGCPYRLIAYHAQQCAEKYIKAYLVYNSVDFPYTHNIRKLLRLCGENIFSCLEEAEMLTAFAVTTRYPGLDEAVTKEEALTAISLAKQVRGHFHKILKDIHPSIEI